MITEVHKTLMAFWSAFGVPAFIAGHVPQDAAFPFITFSPEAGEAFGTSYMTAFTWHRIAPEKGVGAAMEERSKLLDRIAAAIPDGGTTIRTQHGFIALNRAASFQQFYDDPQDKSIIGSRIAYEATFYLR